MFHRILKRSDLIVITNDVDRKYFPDCRQRNILAIYGGVNLEQIEQAKINISAKKEYDAVFCSRIHPQKGISQLLDIWAKVIRRIPDVKLAIIGNGEREYEQFLKEKSQRLGLRNNITWFGYVNGIEKYKIYLKSRLLLHATIFDNNGMVAAEALCAGLPVVMFDLSAFKNLYNQGCVKIPEKNFVCFSQQIIQLLTDSGYYLKKAPTEIEIKAMEDFWNWSRRAVVFKNFLNQYEKNSS